MIKTIIFDIGKVVVKTNFQKIYSNFGEKIGAPTNFVANYYKEKFDDLMLGKITMEQFWDDMRKAGDKKDLDYETLWVNEGIKNREINEDLLKIISKLRRKYILGILTNLTPSRQVIDEKMGIYSHFDYSVLSCVEHLKKPDPKFYKIALSKANAEPNEAIFIDDNLICNQGAENIGMKSILYVYPDNKKLIKELKKFGVDIPS